MLSVAIVEDDRKYSKLLEGYLERYSAENDVKFKVDVFDDGLKFIMGYDGDGGYNIVFMDVEMPRLDGIKTSRKLRATDKNVSLIFVTNMAKYAVSGYEVDALDFMVKPVDYFNFSLKLEKAVRIQSKLSSDVILVGVGGGFTKLKTSDIQYVESSLHFVIYHTETEQIKSRASMKDTEKKLEGMNFARCNNAYLVNLACVKKVTGDEVVMDDGQTLSISRSKKKAFMDALAVYYGGDSDNFSVSIDDPRCADVFPLQPPSVFHSAGNRLRSMFVFVITELLAVATSLAACIMNLSKPAKN